MQFWSVTIQQPDGLLCWLGDTGKACVAEMEAHGVYDACNKHEVPVLVIRGISDFGDSSKDNTFHQVASEAAAIVTKDYATYGWSRI